MQAFLSLHPTVARIALGAIVGAFEAIKTDRAAFLTWKDWHDAATYSWSTASLRAFMGAVVGACGATGLDWMVF